MRRWHGAAPIAPLIRPFAPVVHLVTLVSWTDWRWRRSIGAQFLSSTVRYMPDYLVRGIDEKLAVRIKDYARDRQLTLNDGVLELLAAGLDSRAAHVALSGGALPAPRSRVRMRERA